MRFISTRGASPNVGFVDALLAGLAPDGGLYCPAAWPKLTSAEIGAFAGAAYADVAADVLSRFASDEISTDVLQELCRKAYGGFDAAAVAPLTALSPDRSLLELFHGPTLAFKDVAMQILGRLYAHVLGAQDRRLTVVCATSGDTGGAAVEAFRGLDRVRLVVLFPEGRISEVQRRFMTTAREDNIRTVAVAGDFDDCQSILKSMFQDAAFAKAVDLSAVNSINFVRIIAQSVYYFTAAVALGAPERSVDFTVPTGNFGDAFAGYAARLMGLSIGRIIVATNANDIMARALATGVYRRDTVVETQSPAMDIQVVSNFERLVFECSARDAATTTRLFESFSRHGEMTLPPPILSAIRAVFQGVAVSEAETAAAMAERFSDAGQFIDPHTAVAVAGANRAGNPPTGAPMVIVSTAHAAKFPEAVKAAVGAPPLAPGAVLIRAVAPERIDHLPADLDAVKRYVREFAAT